MSGRRFVVSIVQAAAAVAVATLLALLLRGDALAACVLDFLAVLVLAARGRFLAGALASVLGAAALNWFFLAPVGTFRLSDPRNWLTLAGFLAAATIASRLVTRARERAAEAERRAQEIAQLSAQHEAAKASDEMKTALLRAVSHDLSTPLTSMTLAVDAMRREAGPSEALATLERELALLRRRVENLLSVARLEAGRAVPHREPTPPADAFRVAREHLASLLADRRVTTRVADDCPDLDADPSLVAEILVNLVENAHRASPASEPIELSARAMGRARVALEVLDRGAGPSGSADAGGLGLLIARSFATLQGGTLTLSPREGGGARALVELPAMPW